MDVENANSWRLKNLPDPSRRFDAADTPGTDEDGKPIPPSEMENILKRMIALSRIDLKVNYCSFLDILVLTPVRR